MLLMAGPMIVLFELAIQVARFVDRRRAKRDAAEHFHALSDDEASPLDAAPSELDAAPYDDLRREDDAAPLDDPARSRR
jgi:sec-independent protein translocase protein TatC